MIESKIMNIISKTNTRDGSRTNLRLRSELEAEREKNDALEARIALLVNNTNDVNDEITHLRATITSKYSGPITTYLENKIKILSFFSSRS